MRWRGAFLLLACVAARLEAAETAGDVVLPTLGEIVRIDPRLDELIPKDAKIEVLASGFEWAEGPVWIPEQEGFLLFSDIPRNSVMKWSPRDGLSLFLKPAGFTGVGGYSNEPGSNGLARTKEGRLLFCEHGDRRLSAMDKGGGKRTLADAYQGKRLNSPNDLAIKSNGDIYFTDPPYGLPKQADDPARELDFCGVYRVSKNGALSLLTSDLSRPNGIAFSPDEKLLYVANSDPQKAVWVTFNVSDDGGLDEGKILMDVTDMVGKHKGLPDGLKVDRAGNIFATGPGGVFVIGKDGTLLGRLDTKQATANCGFGDDGSTLYICADMHLCRVKTKTKGAGW